LTKSAAGRVIPIRFGCIRVVSQEKVIHFMPNGEVEQPSESLTVLDRIQHRSRQLALIE